MMKTILKQFLLSLTFVLIINNIEAQQKSQPFEIKDGRFIYEGKSINIYSGEMHYPRIPKEYWRHRLKMVKALGLKTVATYAFWNYHNVAPGVWDFESGNRDIAEYIQIAQEEGLFVILRPGPYVCAEWEFGGYPWWLQKNEDLVVRSDNQAFLDSCKIYFTKLAEQVGNLQVSKGGPIIMVQVENEFGSYIAQRKDIPLSEHKKYYNAIYQMLIEVGFDVPFFTSDGVSLFKQGSIKGILPTANGEGNAESLREQVDKYYQGGPYMVAEYYPGWLDHWGEDFIRISPEVNREQVHTYLENGINFNIYMVHGGTNFAFTSGANYNDDFDIQPDLTSYDYDAPISEAGWTTPKYYLIRNELMNYVDYSVPEIPSKIPIINIPDKDISYTVDFFDWKKDLIPVFSDSLLSFEELNQGYGYVLYSRKFTDSFKGKLEVNGLRDYAIVYVNGGKIGELNRIFKKYELDIDIPSGGTLDILVENMGRINYGSEIVFNEKGITSPVLINNQEIKGEWKMYKVPMDRKPELLNIKRNNIKGKPAFYVINFALEETGDIFLDMREWGKGIVFVNGFNLGRYWGIGPQQTLYLPGCWLKKGENEIIVFEQLNDNLKREIKFTNEPILQDLRLDM